MVPPAGGPSIIKADGNRRTREIDKSTAGSRRVMRQSDRKRRHFKQIRRETNKREPNRRKDREKEREMH